MILDYQIVSICLVTSFFKLLFLNTYRSTDFEVHRNWLAITGSLPFSQWYTENTSQWTLDYPPFFAWFEYILSNLAYYFDWHMLSVKNLNYASKETILFQKLSVIVGDFFLLYAVTVFCESMRSEKPSKELLFSQPIQWWFVVSSTILNAGLVIVDHIHFQYNGFLFGFLVLSISHMVELRYLQSAFWFTVLLNFKHIFLYIAPIYFVYLLRNYCFYQEKEESKGMSAVIGVNIFDINIANLTKLAFVVISIFGVSFGPFIYVGQLGQVLSRLFPVARGLCHAYWAANFWAVYNVMDKAIFIADFLLTFMFISTSPLVTENMVLICSAGNKVGIINASTTVASMTGGLVAQQKFAILPSIAPLHTAVITVIAMLPALLKVWYNPRHWQLFIPGLTLCAYSSFIFGYHVHEKAVMMILIPLILVAWKNAHYARVYIILQTAGHYALFPLLYESPESPLKVLIFILSTLATLHALKAIHKLDSTSALGVPLVMWYEALYMYGLLPLYLLTDAVYPKLYISKQLPFVPLLMTSLYCTIGVLWSWLLLYKYFLQTKCYKVKYK